MFLLIIARNKETSFIPPKLSLNNLKTNSNKMIIVFTCKSAIQYFKKVKIKIQYLKENKKKYKTRNKTPKVRKPRSTIPNFP